MSRQTSSACESSFFSTGSWSALSVTDDNVSYVVTICLTLTQDTKKYDLYYYILDQMQREQDTALLITTKL